MTPHRRALVVVALASLAVALVPSAAQAQIAVSANDNKVVLVNGVVTVVGGAPSDTVSVIDLKASPPRVIGEVAAPVSVVGPPLSVAVTSDESLALVTASNKVDPSDGTKQAPNNQVSVVDLKAGGGMVAITPDGKTALVSRNVDNKVSVLAIDGTRVEYTKRDMTPGLRPIVIDVASTSAFAVVGHLAGGPTGDSDAVTLMDLTVKPPRVVDTVGVLGSTAEGLKISPDASVVAVVVHNGSDRPKESPFFNDAGKLVIVRVTGKTLARVAEAPIGHWSQGVAWSPDGKTLLVGNMVEKDYWVFSWDGSTLMDTGHRVKVTGGPAGIRTAEK